MQKEDMAAAFSQGTSVERAGRQSIYEHFEAWPATNVAALPNLPLFVNRQTMSRVLAFHDLYKMILGVHGVIMEFGVAWGRDLATLINFRGIYEPFNFTRKLIGFDTFEGFPSVHEKDGHASVVKVGGASVADGYEAYLEQVLAYHESECPIAHMKKFELVRGDVMTTLPSYLKNHPETIVALAYLDLDLYEPTLLCLESLRGCLTTGSVVAFDELGDHTWPGETVALKDALGLEKIALQRFPYSPNISYFVVNR